MAAATQHVRGRWSKDAVSVKVLHGPAPLPPRRRSFADALLLPFALCLSACLSVACDDGSATPTPDVETPAEPNVSPGVEPDGTPDSEPSPVGPDVRPDDPVLPPPPMGCGRNVPVECDPAATIVGDVTVFSASDLGQLQGVQCVDGNLDIREVDDLLGMFNVDTLEKVSGTLSLFRNRSLLSTAGMPALREVGGLDVTDNDALVSLSGFSALETAGTVHILGNESLEEVQLERLTTIDADLFVAHNPSLADISGFDCLSGAVDTISFENNPEMTSLDGLEGVALVREEVFVHRMHGLNTLEGLHGVSSVPGSIVIDDNDNLTNLDGLRGLTSTTHLRLLMLPALTSSAGMAALTSVSNLDLENTTLLTMEGFEGITELDYLSLDNNYRMTSLRGLDNLSFISISGSIVSHPALESLDGLESLANVGRHFDISANTALIDISALSQLRNVGGALRFIGDDALVYITDLVELRDVGEVLVLQSNTVLDEVRFDNLAGIGGLVANFNAFSEVDFPVLEVCAGDLLIGDNDNLHTLQAPQLSEVRGEYGVYAMPTLSTLTVPELSRIDWFFSIFDNPLLGDDVAWGIAQQVEDRDGIGPADGCRDFDNNVVSCLFIENNGG